MALSRKHYVEVARILAERAKDSLPTDYTLTADRERKAIARDLARYFEWDNPRFDRDRFLEAADAL